MVTVSHNDCGHECIALSSNRDVSFYGAYPDSSLWVRREAVSRRDLRRRKLLTRLEVADTHKLSRFACALCPNISVDVFGNANYKSSAW